MSSPASVLSRPNDFRAFVPNSAPSPISSGITYWTPTTIVRSSGFTEADLLQQMTDALHVGFTTAPRIQPIIELVHARFTTTTSLTSLLDFSAANLAGIRQTYNAIQQLYQSNNVPRDRQIADRITVLHLDALAEDQHILPASLRQFADFFLAHPDLGLPKITLTPDSTLRARWIRGPRDFVAIEFTGEPLTKLVSEIPREDNLTATHFSSEPIKNIVSIARALSASFTR
jgi:hypothetical protein